MKINSIVTFIQLAVFAIVCDSARILVVLPIPAKSHHYVMQPIILELAKRGHEITFVTSVEMGEKAKNINEIKINLKIEDLIKEFTFENMRKMGEVPVFGLISFWPVGLKVLNETLPDPKMQKLIHSNEKFDLVILETHFGQEALTAFGHKFNAPVISLCTFSTYIFSDEFVGNPFGTSHIPGFELPYSDKMTFFQRVHNTIRVIMSMLTGYFFYLPYQESIMRQYFNYSGSESIPPVREMLEEVALVIVNSQISVDYPRAWVPNVIGVAGLHIKPNKPLPKDIKEFMDNSKNGVVYVSFGSVVPSEKMPEDMRQEFIKAFSKFNQNVLWKIGLDSVPGLPKNVKIGKWFPQQDILAHPNCVAFITHGGLLSQQEAVYFTVPLIGVPFFGDQYHNVMRAAAAGFAIHLDQYNITDKSLTWAVNEVINNPMYWESIKKHSLIFRDNPIDPREKAVYWIEYILKHKGAPHLRSQARKLSWIQYLLLDIISFITLILLVILLLFYKILKFITSFCRKKKEPLVKQSKKKN